MAINRSKMAYLNYADMLQKLEDKRLDEYDLCFAKDQNVFYIVSPDLELKRVNGRVDTFDNVSQALVKLNNSSDTYEGKIIAIYNASTEIYEAYIVNKKGNSFMVSLIRDGYTEINYDELNNLPIINLTDDKTIVLSEKNDGIYKVSGTYKLAENDETIRIAASSTLFFVKHTTDDVIIKIIDADEIADYKCGVDGVKREKYITENNDYVTMEQVDVRIGEQVSDRELMSSTDTKEYIEQSQATTEDIQNLFKDTNTEG